MKCNLFRPFSLSLVLLLSLAGSFCPVPDARAFLLSVKGPNNEAVGPYRWLVEEDTTHPVTPGSIVANSLAVSIHKGHSSVVASGTSANLSPLNDASVINPGQRYFISILPDVGFSIGGAQIAAGQSSVKVVVAPYPIPTAQISVFVFEDNKAISGVAEIPAEKGLPNFNIQVADILGQQMTDVFGNILGTTYLQNPDGTYQTDAQGNPVVDIPGEGIVTDTKGFALIKNLAPGKYNITATPQDGREWIQTVSIGGTPQLAAIVKAGEPPLFTQGGLLNMHVFIGFVRPFRDLPTGTATITGRIVNLHSPHPPSAEAFAGSPVEDCFVGLNIVEAGTEQGVLAQACSPDSTFTLTNIPAGTYQLVMWDRPLDNLMNVRTITVSPGETLNLEDLPISRWLATFEGSVFLDTDRDGIRDPGEMGIPGQAINLRYRDGSILQGIVTDSQGAFSLAEVLPLGKWIVSEVDFTRLQPTGATFTVDQGGPVVPGAVNTPQPQPDPGNPGSFFPYRTETGVVLLEGMILHPDQVNTAEWGKAEYGPGPDGTSGTADDENGGIAGIIYYATTRAENDPRFAVGEGWEPGIPRVQVNLYQDADGDGNIDDIDGRPGIQLADVDNAPFDWKPDPANPGKTLVRGPEDIDRDDGILPPWNGALFLIPATPSRL